MSRMPDVTERAETFERWGKAISIFEEQTSNNLGYRFLYCPRENLWEHNGVLLLGLNPGGRQVGRSLEVAEGLAYRVETWEGQQEPGKANIQQQVMRLLSALTPDPERTLCSNLVFFRSPDWKTLRDRKEVVEFCAGLWTEILGTLSAFDLRIFMGKRTYDIAASAVEGLRVPTFTDEIPLWAGARVLLDRSPERPTTLVLPHLSRWRFVREGNDAFAKLVDLVG